MPDARSSDATAGSNKAQPRLPFQAHSASSSTDFSFPSQRTASGRGVSENGVASSNGVGGSADGDRYGTGAKPDDVLVGGDGSSSRVRAPSNATGRNRRPSVPHGGMYSNGTFVAPSAGRPPLPSRASSPPPKGVPTSSSSSSYRTPQPSSSSNGSFSASTPFAPLGALKEGLLSTSSALLLANVKFVLLCSLWYMSSAVSSNTGKAIFNLFKFPVTLTIVQFGFIAFYCYAYTRPALGVATLREPSRALLRGVLPMAAFQVCGHVFSSVATSRVPVSTVHTIKALSPLFTVLSYRFLFGVTYSPSTYISLIPLTLGVMFACSFDVSASNVFGLVCAFGSTLIFVSSNIFFKKLVPSTAGSAASAKDGAASTNSRLDKINLLFYSSSLAFVFMLPLWFYSDLFPILADSARRSATAPPRVQRVLYYFVLNGTSHFAQNVLAFNILSSTSPVTYSIASLVKRIVVILMAIVWFGQTVHPVQALGIGLTFVGLYMYQAAKGEIGKMEKKVRKIEAIREGSFLPSSTGDSKLMAQAGSSKDFKSMFQHASPASPSSNPHHRSPPIHPASMHAQPPPLAPLPPPPHNFSSSAASPSSPLFHHPSPHRQYPIGAAS